MDFPNNKTFYVSVKALFFDGDNKLLMIREKNGLWEVPGGKVTKNESFEDALIRECQEEMGITPTILDKMPAIAYPTLDRGAKARIMLFYRVSFPSLNFSPSDECEEIKFFRKEEIDPEIIYPQLVRLLDYI